MVHIFGNVYTAKMPILNASTTVPHMDVQSFDGAYGHYGHCVFMVTLYYCKRDLTLWMQVA